MGQQRLRLPALESHPDRNAPAGHRTVRPRQQDSSKYLDIPAASTATNTATQQFQNSACSCQLNSNLNLDIRNSSSTAGAAIVQNTASSADSQKWTLTDAGNGYYKLRNVNSSLVAGVAQSSTTNGAAVVQWNSLTVDDQLWKIVRIN